jgi:beta-glucosidase-like glycosyl hydrolase
LSAFRLCNSNPSCAALALSAGVDIEQPPSQLYLSLGDAISANLTSLSDVDAAVSRVLLHKFDKEKLLLLRTGLGTNLEPQFGLAAQTRSSENLLLDFGFLRVSLDQRQSRSPEPTSIRLCFKRT